MSTESVNPTIVASYARRFTVEMLDAAIADVSEAVLTSSFSNLSVLGMNINQDGARVDVILQTLEAARSMKIAEEDPTAAGVALDAKDPLGHGLNFSNRRIE